MGLTLREVRDEDLPLLFEQWADPVAVHMAAFTAPDHMERDAFERRWSRLRADDTVLAQVIVVDDDVAGTIGSWGDPGERQVTYWIGRSYWGKGDRDQSRRRTNESPSLPSATSFSSATRIDRGSGSTAACSSLTAARWQSPRTARGKAPSVVV
jgi:Acetyltransferase (GNAT) domain